MKKLFAILFILALTNYKTEAQNTDEYGQVSTADLLLKDCDFEKGANAMILLDKGDAVTDVESVSVKYFKRIKIFNDAGKREANVRLVYYSGDGLEQIKSVEAETINLENGQVVVTKVDATQFFYEQVDKYHKAIIFTFPKVRAGSIIEYKYNLWADSPSDFHGWSFQADIPVRYSELTAKIAHGTLYTILNRGYQPFVKDTSIALNGFMGKGSKQCWWAKANLHSYVSEPFVTPGIHNLDRINFRLSYMSSGFDYVKLTDTWEKIAFKLVYQPEFKDQLNQRLSNQDTLIKNALALSTDDEKIAYLFNVVKQKMVWDKTNYWLGEHGARPAWNKKTGNSAEINLILYNLLKRAGIKVYPILLSTRDNGALEPNYAGWGNINSLANYIPTADTSKYYVLDASNKYNLYDNIPAEFLNTYGVIIHPEKHENVSQIKLLQNENPAKHVVIINADISADNKVNGSVDIADYSYNRSFYLDLHKKIEEDKYMDYLIAGTPALKITKPAFENMEVDSLPLIQKFNFTQEIAGANDNQYIYLNSNLFSLLHDNPFINEKRYSDIDFGYCNAYNINATYKLPAGYKIDALPKSMVLNMPGKSIVFKRVIGELNGALQVHYFITYNQSTYSLAQYRPIREFYKTMYDMLNEPIVLKKL